MSRFTGPLAVVFLSARSRHARLLEDLVWEAGAKGSGRVITVPAGHVSDGVTMPRPLWWLVPPHGHQASRAARLHDYLLDRLRAGRPHPHAPTRRAIDHEFQLALRATGVGPCLAWTMWAGVRLWARVKGEA